MIASERRALRREYWRSRCFQPVAQLRFSVNKPSTMARICSIRTARRRDEHKEYRQGGYGLGAVGKTTRDFGDFIGRKYGLASQNGVSLFERAFAARGKASA